jgi:hypothetical protein
VCQTKVTQTSNSIQYQAETAEYRYEYRGGVEARVDIADADLTPASLGQLRDRIFAARPSTDSVTWAIA